MPIATTRSPRFTAALGATALLLALAGCSAPAPSAETQTGKSPLVSESELDAARDAYDLKMAQCLRDKGFDIKDPLPGKGIQEYSDEIWAGMKECTEVIGNMPMSDVPPDETAILRTALVWADCFRDLGYEVEEPKLGSGFAPPEDATQQEIDTCISAGQ